jgi:rare lipoprotein A
MLLPCALVCVLAPAARGQVDIGYSEVGIASYYGSEFHGRSTATGERFNMWAMTAAHKSLPYDARVRVTNLENNQSVVVRINDHGPFKPGRIIDLSKGAAARIGMIAKGTTKVRLEVIDIDAREDYQKEKGNTEFYSVDLSRDDIDGFAIQVASFSEMANLIRHVSRLQEKGISNVHVQMATVEGTVMHRIVVGGFATETQAAGALLRLREKGINGFVFAIRD